MLVLSVTLSVTICLIQSQSVLLVLIPWYENIGHRNYAKPLHFIGHSPTLVVNLFFVRRSVLGKRSICIHNVRFGFHCIDIDLRWVSIFFRKCTIQTWIHSSRDKCIKLVLARFLAIGLCQCLCRVFLHFFWFGMELLLSQICLITSFFIETQYIKMRRTIKVTLQ